MGNVTPSTELAEFALNLNQEVLHRSANEESTSFQADHFTQAFIEILEEAGEFEDDPVVFSFRKPGIECNAYCVSGNEERLDLVISRYFPQNEISSMPKGEVTIAFEKLRGFLKNSCKGFHEQLEEASPAFDAAQTILQLKNSENLTSIRLFFLTNGIIQQQLKLPKEHFEGSEISYHIWDVQRLYKCVSSGQRREIIELDLTAPPFNPIPCIQADQPDSQYTTYLGVIPGELLADIYAECGPRLLERNVRSFLQARGKINMGIRDCLVETPDMFLAYNNGISTTAAGVTMGEGPNGLPVIKHLTDFQIVNGGQTTASIFAARTKQRADLSRVNVQFKLTVLKKPEEMDQVVPKISEYANSQNKIHTADFSANDPYHRKLEELSRTVWAPAPEGSPESTRWYYERARGQFADELNRARTPAAKKLFLRTNPKSQMFTKTDLAKFVNSWEQLPHKVSAGAQANFREFTVRLKESGIPNPDLQYFQRLVARAILFRRAEQIVSDLNFGGYRANIVTYTLAWLSRLTSRRINLDSIWSRQDISPVLVDAIKTLAGQVHAHITTSGGLANVTQWCKKEECWKQLSVKTYKLPKALDEELVVIGPGAEPSTPVATPENPLAKEILAVSGAKWKELSSWAKQTGSLQGWQRGIAYGIGERLERNVMPSDKQIKQGLLILEEARRLGFKFD